MDNAQEMDALQEAFEAKGKEEKFAEYLVGFAEWMANTTSEERWDEFFATKEKVK